MTLRCAAKHDTALKALGFVVDFDEEEALRWCGGACGGARVGGDDCGNLIGRGAASAYVDEGSDEIADHMVQEA